MKVSKMKRINRGQCCRLLFQFAMPFLLSNLIQTLYNVTDMLIVGNYMGAVRYPGSISADR